jgi:hypothetical protein
MGIPSWPERDVMDLARSGPLPKADRSLGASCTTDMWVGSLNCCDEKMDLLFDSHHDLDHSPARREQAKTFFLFGGLLLEDVPV